MTGSRGRFIDGGIPYGIPSAPGRQTCWVLLPRPMWGGRTMHVGYEAAAPRLMLRAARLLRRDRGEECRKEHRCRRGRVRRGEVLAMAEATASESKLIIHLQSVGEAPKLAKARVKIDGTEPFLKVTYGIHIY